MGFLIVLGLALLAFIFWFIFSSLGGSSTSSSTSSEAEQSLYKLKQEKSYQEISHKHEIEALEQHHSAQLAKIKKECDILKKQVDDLETRWNAHKSNLTAIPYMSAIMADFETYNIEILAKSLDWGHSVERSKKVASIREIRKAAIETANRNLYAKYQLEYLLRLFPELEDVIDSEYDNLPVVTINDIEEHDSVRDWLSKEEYQNLDSVSRNQLALDRYMQSRTKTKWQIGRDYELYVGYRYQKKGYQVDFYGSYMGLEDLGRDLIAKKNGSVLIVQCKYWSKEKKIHEKHITQLFGSMVSYSVEHNLTQENVKGVLVTNIELSKTAKKIAGFLGIQYVENYEKGQYPCIKCNIGRSEHGFPTKIYHLPFDLQYDSTKIDGDGEFMAMTVKEAEDAGFRRSFKWFGNG